MVRGGEAIKRRLLVDVCRGIYFAATQVGFTARNLRQKPCKADVESTEAYEIRVVLSWNERDGDIDISIM